MGDFGPRAQAQKPVCLSCALWIFILEERIEGLLFRTLFSEAQMVGNSLSLRKHRSVGDLGVGFSRDMLWRGPMSFTGIMWLDPETGYQAPKKGFPGEHNNNHYVKLMKHLFRARPV